MSVILGIDPGSRIAGFGVIEISPDGERHLDHGVIRLSEKASLSERLHEMHQAMDQLFTSFKPQSLVVEDIFLGKNPRSAFVLGHIRGVVLERGRFYGSNFFEYAPKTIKKSLTGNGSASKDQVRFMVTELLGVESTQMNDATDALAVAMTHAKHVKPEYLLARNEGVDL